MGIKTTYPHIAAVRYWGILHADNNSKKFLQCVHRHFQRQATLHDVAAFARNWSNTKPWPCQISLCFPVTEAIVYLEEKLYILKKSLTKQYILCKFHLGNYWNFKNWLKANNFAWNLSAWMLKFGKWKVAKIRGL